MFGIVYRFKVRPGKAEAFIDAWARMTVAIHEQRGGLGSRLHDAGDNVFFAYAQWPAREIRDASTALDSPDAQASADMRDCLESSETLLSGEVTADLLSKTE
ncbi:MAG: antibiotic biosynthesis monooxygenase [Planctomycetes bacterium]|nr:antibiotic biosynthesis monooxygenase [Planctomycetota bacterium]